MRVIREGRPVEEASVDMGPVVHRDDAYFSEYIGVLKRRKRIGLLFLLGWDAGMVIIWLVLDQLPIFLGGVVVISAMIPLLQYLNFGHLSSLDGPVAVHANGVDMVETSIGRARRVFVPWGEVEDVTRVGNVFGLCLRGREYVSCDEGLVDEGTEGAIRSLMAKGGVVVGPPELHVYPRDEKSG